MTQCTQNHMREKVLICHNINKLYPGAKLLAGQYRFMKTVKAVEGLRNHKPLKTDLNISSV